MRYLLDEMYQFPNKKFTTEKTKMRTFMIDFEQTNAWYTINDNVMGGISKGGMQESQSGIAIFKGQLSLENRGGFSSTRLKIPSYSLGGYKGLEIRVKGDERLYTLLVSTAQMRGSWQKDFTAHSGWQTISVPFDDMQLSIRGWVPSNAPKVQAQEINAIGLMIKDKNETPFQLEIDWIRGIQ